MRLCTDCGVDLVKWSHGPGPYYGCPQCDPRASATLAPMGESNAMTGHVERRKELLADIGSLLLSNAGSGKRGRLMRQTAAWLASLCDCPTDRDLDDVAEELAGWDR